MALRHDIRGRKRSEVPSAAIVYVKYNQIGRWLLLFVTKDLPMGRFSGVLSDSRNFSITKNLPNTNDIY
jgi:hypothetical protein